MKKNKQEVIALKVNKSLLDARKGIESRSELIRNAIYNVCPLFCKGSGILSPSQKGHSDNFFVEHTLEECEKYNELYFTCVNQQNSKIQRA